MKSDIIGQSHPYYRIVCLIHVCDKDLLRLFSFCAGLSFFISLFDADISFNLNKFIGLGNFAEVFRDSRFFDEHEFFYIYTPGHILTYRIAAAIQFDTRHILHNFDFSDDQVYDDWLQNYVLRPKTMVRNVRKDLELSIDDRLVILSTCLEHGASRYLIEGVLVSDEPTN